MINNIKTISIGAVILFWIVFGLTYYFKYKETAHQLDLLKQQYQQKIDELNKIAVINKEIHQKTQTRVNHVRAQKVSNDCDASMRWLRENY
jgi:hypothetical protein